MARNSRMVWTPLGCRSQDGVRVGDAHLAALGIDVERQAAYGLGIQRDAFVYSGKVDRRSSR